MTINTTFDLRERYKNIVLASLIVMAFSVTSILASCFFIQFEDSKESRLHATGFLTFLALLIFGYYQYRRARSRQLELSKGRHSPRDALYLWPSLLLAIVTVTLSITYAGIGIERIPNPF